MGQTPTQSGVLKFGVFEIDLEAGELRKSGMRQKIAGQPFEALRILLEHPQEIVSREELRQRLWQDKTFVDYDLALKKVINRVREALGDSAENPRFIETIPRKGYRFIAPISRNGAATVPPVELPSAPTTTPLASRRNWRPSIALGLVAAALLLVLLGFMRHKLLKQLSGEDAAPQIRSIAVLPLQNLSGDPAQEYFSDGMTDALITDLAQIGSLKVISRTSSMQYKQTKKSLPEIARELNVDGIVEGTVQRSGDRVRITAQLVHGPSDRHLWANSYERDLRDVFALERHVTADITHQVEARLTPPNQGQPAQPQPVNPEALDAYFQGNYHLNGFGKGSGDEEKRNAVKFFQQAIDADPNFAVAYIGLADAHVDLMWPSKHDGEIATRAAERAVELDPGSSDARVALGDIKFSGRWDFHGAEEQYRRALALSPNNAKAHEALGDFLVTMGRGDEGLRECRIAQELDPSGDHLREALYAVGEYDRAIAVAQTMLQIGPQDGFVHHGLYRYYATKKMYKEASLEAEKALGLFGDPEGAARIHHAFVTSGYRAALRAWARELERLIVTKKGYFPINLAGAYAILGDNDHAFYWLEESYKNHERYWGATELGLEQLNNERIFDPLRSDPKFKDLMRRVGLPQ